MLPTFAVGNPWWGLSLWFPLHQAGTFPAELPSPPAPHSHGAASALARPPPAGGSSHQPGLRSTTDGGIYSDVCIRSGLCWSCLGCFIVLNYAWPYENFARQTKCMPMSSYAQLDDQHSFLRFSSFYTKSLHGRRESVHTQKIQCTPARFQLTPAGTQLE